MSKQFHLNFVRTVLLAAGGIVLHELVARQPSLEEAFMTLTRDAVDYQPRPTGTGQAARA